MSSAREIAAKLSKAQREAILSNDNWMIDDLAARNPRLAKSLHKLGITYVELSPIGLEVRSILQEKQP